MLIFKRPLIANIEQQCNVDFSLSCGAWDIYVYFPQEFSIMLKSLRWDLSQKLRIKDDTSTLPEWKKKVKLFPYSRPCMQ